MSLWAILALGVGGGAAEPAPSGWEVLSRLKAFPFLDPADPEIFVVPAGGKFDIASVDSVLSHLNHRLCVVLGLSEAAAWNSLEGILRGSTIAQQRIREGSLLAMAALHDPGTHSLAWLGSHPDQARLLASSLRGGRPARVTRAAPTPAPYLPVSGTLLRTIPWLLIFSAGVVLGIGFSRRRARLKEIPAQM